MLAALDCQPPDYTPCSFMLFNALKQRCSDYFDFIDRQLDLGLDAYVQVPVRPPVVVNDYYNLHGLPVSYHHRVSLEEWITLPAEEEHPILNKCYHTPAGDLTVEVRQTPDWRWGEHVPFLDDYIIPRSKKFLISAPQDLEALRYLLRQPTPAEEMAFQIEAQDAKQFADQKGLLLAGGWGVGADLCGWVFGLENMIFAAYDQPSFMRDMLELIAAWNRARMGIILEAGIDLFIKRAWYENCDFWSPTTWREFIFPILKADVDYAHEHGARFGYLITSNCMPLLNSFSEAGVDVLIGVDPQFWDLAKTKAALGGKVCLWGGVNGHLTVELGTPEQVRAETRKAMSLLSPQAGFILSPVDNVRQDTPLANRNVRELIAEWNERK
jgi:hypothetical protein